MPTANAYTIPYRASATRINTTQAVTVYTAADGFNDVRVIHVANRTDADHRATITWFVAADDTSYTIRYRALVPANDALQIEITALEMLKDDKIKVTAETANVLDVIVTRVEYAGRSA